MTTHSYDQANWLETEENGSGRRTLTFDDNGSLRVEETVPGCTAYSWYLEDMGVGTGQSRELPLVLWTG